MNIRFAGLNRFYYLLYTRYNNSCTASVIFVWCSVFIWRYPVSLFERAQTCGALFTKLPRPWTGKIWIKHCEESHYIACEHTGHVLSTVNFLHRNRFVVFLIFPSFAHDHCGPLHFDLDPSLPPSYPHPHHHHPHLLKATSSPNTPGVSTYCC